MSNGALAGSTGPHVFVASREHLALSDDDTAHLERSLRMRDGAPLTVSDGRGAWAPGVLRTGGVVELTEAWREVPEPAAKLTVAFSLVKGSKPELVVQKLTELGVDRIVGLVADRSVVRWDDAKIDKATQRWNRIVLEASMQSHRVRLPEIGGVVETHSFFLSEPGVSLAHFDGEPVGPNHRCISIGPEGGWSDRELEITAGRVSLGETVLRAETAAIAAGTLLTAARRSA